MKQHKNLNLKLNIFKTNNKALLIIFSISNFSKRIFNKYFAHNNSNRFPALVFLMLFSKGIMNNITNIYRPELINNHFRLHLSFYLRMFDLKINSISSKQLIKILKQVHNDRIYYLSNFSNSFPNIIAWISQSTQQSKEGNPNLSLQDMQTQITQPLMTGFKMGPQFNFSIISLRNQLKMTNYNIKYLLRLLSYKQVLKNMAYNSLRSIAFNDTKFAINNVQYNISYTPHAIRQSPEDNFYFYNQRKIEQEVEGIKKVIFETKEAMRQINYYSPRDIKMAIKQHLDINRISEQVYQNIEKRIRIERERKGLI